MTQVNLGRHRRYCTVCAHEKCAEIEADFIGWKSPAAIAEEYDLADRSSVYRHAHAFGLFEKRKRNVRAALERIIEKAGEVEVTASAVVGAVQAYSKINALGQWVDRSEQISLNDLFERMSTEELELYAKEGRLPAWFSESVPATILDSPGGTISLVAPNLERLHEPGECMPETESIRPGNFPVGSPRSRAAAKLLATQKGNSTFELVLNPYIRRPVRRKNPQAQVDVAHLANRYF